MAAVPAPDGSPPDTFCRVGGAGVATFPGDKSNASAMFRQIAEEILKDLPCRSFFNNPDADMGHFAGIQRTHPGCGKRKNRRGFDDPWSGMAFLVLRQIGRDAAQRLAPTGEKGGQWDIKTDSSTI
ncbi:MAG: hypothetical protein OEW11_01505 [Nitrospirota bacterium]|nr:hypothetical protein [Nitrospirota bacterium]